MRSLIRVAAVGVLVPLAWAISANGAAAKPLPKAPTPNIIVTASPNPVVETSTSVVNAVIQVEANPRFAGDAVTVSSTQLSSRCPGIIAPFFFTESDPLGTTGPAITLTLDNDGNAMATVAGFNCAPGSALIDASLDAPPFATATTKLVMLPPQVTAPGLHVFPNPEVEVGDGGPAAPGAVVNAPSEAEFMFYVETNPVYAEQSASITSDQFTERCGAGGFWSAPTATTFPTWTAPANGLIQAGTIDNDGNVVFEAVGASCAAGKSTVIAEIGGGGPTYSAQATILPPAVTV
jgi:hypothetical protein